MNSHRNRAAVAAAALAYAVPIFARQQAPDAAKLRNHVAATAESIAAGRNTYQKTCASCHGSSGEGGPGNDLIPAAPSLVDDRWDHGSSDGEIFDNVRNGIPPDFSMVGFKDKLSDDEIWNVVNYLRTLAKPQ